MASKTQYNTCEYDARMLAYSSETKNDCATIRFREWSRMGMMAISCQCSRPRISFVSSHGACSPDRAFAPSFPRAVPCPFFADSFAIRRRFTLLRLFVCIACAAVGRGCAFDCSAGRVLCRSLTAPLLPALLFRQSHSRSLPPLFSHVRRRHRHSRSCCCPCSEGRSEVWRRRSEMQGMQ